MAATKTALLLAYGADPQIKDEYGNIPLHGTRSVPALRLLLDHGIDINARNKEGWTPLLVAADRFPAIVVKELIARGADVNIRDEHGRTPLHHAVIDNDVDGATAKRLLKIGADPNARDENGRTPLHQAAGCHFLAGAKVLLAAGADVNARDAEGKTPLYCAEIGPYLGRNAYYVPPPEGQGDPVYYEKRRRKIAAFLRQAGAQL